MAVLNVSRETSLPAAGALRARTIYFVAPSGDPDFAELYITGNSPSAIKRLFNKNDVQALIDASLSSTGSTTVVDTIAERDALTPSNGATTVVIDATDDPTVDSGTATYVYRADTSTWIKTSESESLDLVLDWANLSGKPNSTPAAIDQAVSSSHTHANKTVLDQLSEDADGNLAYAGQTVRTTWDTEAW